MDMKRTILLSLALAAVLPGSLLAQDKYGPNKDECIKYLSYYQEYYKQKNYESALPNWRKAFNVCPPTASQNMLIHGSTLMTRQIARNGKDPKYVKELADTLIMLQDLRLQYYPNAKVTVLNNKGQYLIKYRGEDTRALFGELEQIVDELKGEANASILVFDLQSAIKLYQDGDLSADEVLATYEKVIGYVDGAQPKNDEDAEKLAQTRSDLQGIFVNSRIASCDNILAIFAPRYEADPSNAELASTIVKLMNSAEGCTDNHLYMSAVTTIYENDPTSVSPYLLYQLSKSKGDNAKAIEYLEAAVEAEPANAGKYTYELANFCLKNNMRARAYGYAQKAASTDPAWAGKAYFLMGTIWGSSSCGDDEISRRAPYWVAVDYLQKAKNADATLTDDANRLIGQFRSYFPQTAEAFMYDLTDGQSYTVSCNGMTATTTVRTNK